MVTDNGWMSIFVIDVNTNKVANPNNLGQNNSLVQVNSLLHLLKKKLTQSFYCADVGPL